MCEVSPGAPPFNVENFFFEAPWTDTATLKGATFSKPSCQVDFVWGGSRFYVLNYTKSIRHIELRIARGLRRGGAVGFNHTFRPPAAHGGIHAGGVHGGITWPGPPAAHGGIHAGGVPGGLWELGSG